MHSTQRLITHLLPTCLIAVATISSAIAQEVQVVPPKLKERFAMARTERIAVIGIGDSNQRFGGHGYSFYMRKAFSETFGCYATSLELYHPFAEKDHPTPVSAPSAQAGLAYSYWYIEPGIYDSVSRKHGQLVISKDHPLDITGHLRFHLTYATFEQGAGIFRPMIRRDDPPYTILQSEKDPIQAGPFPPKLLQYTLDLPADSKRDFPLMFAPSAVNVPIQGAFYGSSSLCENVDKTSGIAYHTLYAVGGQSLYDMLIRFREDGPTRLTEYFSRVRDVLNGKKTCIIMITSGLNDRHEKERSIGPIGNLSSSSSEGYADNLEGIVQTLQEAWIQAGGTVDTIHFAFMPSHVLGQPDDHNLVSYREAARSVAAKLPNASAIDLEKLVPYQQMLDGHYYNGDTTTNPHLDRKGYEAIATALTTKLLK